MLIKVKVFPGSKEKAVIKKSEDNFEVKIEEKAERGLANKAVIEILCSYFRTTPSNIRLIKGTKQRNKIFEIKK